MRITTITSIFFCLASVLASTSALAAQPDPAQEPAPQLPPPVAATPTPSPAAAPAAPPAADVPPGEEPKPAEQRELRRAYVSFSPFHLIMPFFEVTGEFRVLPKMGVAAIGGGGSVDVKNLVGGGSTKVSLWEVGGQIVGYPIGDFDHGMQVGAEVLYLGAKADANAGEVKVTGSGTGLATGAFIGYKLATKVGFTFNVQGGVSYLAVRADANSSSSSAHSEKGQFAPLVNANIGWSF